jgi:sulfur carrier protein
MNIYVNNKLQELAASAKITDALSSLNIPSQKGIAIAINNNVIPRTEWETHILQPDDKVTIIKATQGG